MIVFVVFIVIINVFLFIKLTKVTIPFILLINSLFLPLYYFHWSLSVLAIIGALLNIGYKFYLVREEKPPIEYEYKVSSVIGLLNHFNKSLDNSIAIGRVLPVRHSELKYNRKLIHIEDDILRGGTLISGSSGSGKTTTLKSIIQQKLEKGYPVCFIDYKGDLDIIDDLKVIANQLKIDFFEYSSRECNFYYDSFKNLNETGKVEALMNTRQWSANGSDAHYKSSTQLAIQNVIKQYEKVHKEEDNYILGLYKFTLGYKPDSNEKEGHYTLLKQLEIIITSKANELFTNKEKVFTFERETPYLVVFSFVSANKSLANSLSSFIFQDILDRGIRKPFNKNLVVAVDEFGTIESPVLIKDLLEKGRSGGCQTVFSILDLNQLAISTNEYFVQSILGTINNFLIFAGATQKTAELLAGVQKYDGKDFDIMSLRKPFRRKPPTALFISKFPLLRKKGNQDLVRIEPYTHKVKTKMEVIENVVVIEEPEEKQPIVTTPDLDETVEGTVISNIDEFL